MNKFYKKGVKPSLCIFANFQINNEERLLRLIDSFNSFEGYNPDQWEINIRGTLKKEAGKFLKKYLGDKLNLSFMDSRGGWIHDSKKLSRHIKTDLVMVWIEDHIFMNTYKYFEAVLKEMHFKKVNCLYYSFYTEENKKFFNKLPKNYSGICLNSWKFDKELNQKCNKEKLSEKYSIPMMSIMTLKFFNEVLSCPRPYFKRWPKSYPFDFEKKIKDTVSPSYTVSFPKYELFAAIDDDQNNANYSLISRGLYPDRMKRTNIQETEYSATSLKKLLKKIMPKNLFFIFIKGNRFIRRIFYTIDYIFINL